MPPNHAFQSGAGVAHPARKRWSIPRAFESARVVRKKLHRCAEVTILALLCVGCEGNDADVASNAAPPVGPPPDAAYQPYRQLMPQVADQGPLLTTSSEEVPLQALIEAASFMATMLELRPDVVATLQEAGALTAVFGRMQNVCDLPYFEDLEGSAVCDDAAGGLGGVPGRPATACSEKNLLKQQDDPFGRGTRADGENVCVHELAHTIMNVGLSDGERNAIVARYNEAIEENRWDGDFALANADEFFAEMTQVYFCANPEVMTFNHNHGVNCADELQAFDPATHALIENIYIAPSDLR